MEYKPKDFEKLLCNIYDVPPDKDLLEHFPKLNQFKEFAAINHIPLRNRIIRYIILMYDKESPFTRIPNIITRKIECAKEAGFVVGFDGKFNEEAETLIRGGNTDANKMIIKYLRLHRSPSFSYLVTLNEAFYLNSLKIIEDTGDEKNVKLITQLHPLIERTAVDILNNDNNQILLESVYSEIEDSTIALSPESIASNTRDSKPPIKKPRWTKSQTTVGVKRK